MLDGNLWALRQEKQRQEELEKREEELIETLEREIAYGDLEQIRSGINYLRKNGIENAEEIVIEHIKNLR